MKRRVRERARRCDCGKTVYSRRGVAVRAAARLPVPGRVYWAPCGGWHITHMEQADYDRAQAGR